MAVAAPFGSWASPISIEMMSAGSVGIGQVFSDVETLYWTESRPDEGGRTALVRLDANGDISDVGPADFNARSRAHEYGGGAAAAHDDVVVATRFEDQRVYRIDEEGATPITPEPEIPAGDRFADFVFRGGLIVAVRERHRLDREPVNELVVFPADGSAEPSVIVTGADFYSSPRISPDGTRLAWLSWNHPNMPWDGTELWVAALLPDGRLSEPEHVAGGDTESVFQPEWSPQGELHYVSDRTGWWNLYRRRDGEKGDLFPMEADFGTAQWLFGMRRYAFFLDGSIACIYDEAGKQHLAELDEGTLTRIGLGCDTIASTIAVTGRCAWVVAGSSTQPLAVTRFCHRTGVVERVRESFSIDFDPAYVSRPSRLEFPTTGGATAHAFYYPPTNPDYVAPEGERPPLLVLSHGGPTGQTTCEIDLAYQFWTSRGFALVDVNYRGSTGYGRAYRDALKGEWGIIDTDDCIAAARHLAEDGHIDLQRMAIRGGSAGGYTTLCALTFRDDFAAGASYFGVADIALLVEHTHKFESRYIDSMIGPYPEAEETYRERSPLHFAQELSCPVILLQGLDDKVVPPEQAEKMVAALDANDIPHAYVAFPGEAHGFRRAETVQRAREAELYFYSRVFEFEPADELAPVPIVNEDLL